MHSLTCYTFDFIHIVSSAGINKCITREFDCLPYLRFLLLLLAFGIYEFRSPAAFKMELSITKGWKILLFTESSILYVARARNSSLKIIGKLR